MASSLASSQRAATGLEVEPDLPVNVRGYREWLNRQPGAAAGERNDTASTIIGYAFDFGVSKATALPMIYEWGARCTPPIPCPDEKIENHGLWSKRQNTGSPLALDALTSEVFADHVAGLVADIPPEYERFYPFTVSELRNRPPPVWLIEDVIREKAVGHFYGPTGSYKSYLVAALAHTVALGKPVVYAIGEGEDMFAGRVVALETVTQAEHHMRLVTEVPIIALPGDVEAFIMAMKAHKIAPALVILDTLAVAMESLDESAAKDMGRFVAAMKKIRSELGCAVAAIHHKSDKEGARGERGSSVLKAGVDFAGEITGYPESRCVKLVMTKQRGSPLRRKPFTFRGTEVAGELAFQPIDLVEFDRLTKAGAGSSDVARKMAAKGLWGEDKGVTTAVLASIVREPVAGERPEEAEAALAQLVKELNRRAHRDLAALAFGEGTERRWWLTQADE